MFPIHHRDPHPQAVVYLVQEPSVPRHGGRRLDTTPLIWWGKVRILVERNQIPANRPNESFIQLHARLSEFDHDRDYIAVAGGDTMGVMMVGAVLRDLGHDYAYFLRFDRTRLPDGTRDPSSGEYFPIMMPLNVEAAQYAIDQTRAAWEDRTAREDRTTWAGRE